MPTQAATQAHLTIQRIETAQVPETGMWTAWVVGHSAIWGIGKSETSAISDLNKSPRLLADWISQGLLTAETARRIEAGGQVWQEVKA